MLYWMPSASVNRDIARLAKGEIILKDHQSYQFLSIFSLLNLMGISRWKPKIDCALFFEGYPFYFFFQTKKSYGSSLRLSIQNWSHAINILENVFFFNSEKKILWCIYEWYRTAAESSKREVNKLN